MNRQHPTPTLRTTTLSSGAQLSGYDFGAHLTRWQTAQGHDWLFLSSKADVTSGKAIRGGVPVIFPQFNAMGPGPRHGFARTALWQHCPSDHPGQLQWQLNHYDVCDAAWPFHFYAKLIATLSGQSLSIKLLVENTGEVPFSFTAALHTYLRIADLHKTKLSGLQGLAYWDNDGSDFADRKTFSNDTLQLRDALDRIYFDVQSPLQLLSGEHALHIDQKGFRDTVVWNPGEIAAARLSDLGRQEYRQMLCVEAAAIDHPISVDPNEAWEGEQILTTLS